LKRCKGRREKVLRLGRQPLCVILSGGSFFQYQLDTSGDTAVSLALVSELLDCDSL